MKHAVTQQVLDLLHKHTNDRFEADPADHGNIDILKVITTDNMWTWTFRVHVKDGDKLYIFETWNNPADYWENGFTDLEEFEIRLQQIYKN